jgi:hypothetical protein
LKRKLKVNAAITFTPTGGSPNTETERLKMRSEYCGARPDAALLDLLRDTRFWLRGTSWIAHTGSGSMRLAAQGAPYARVMG